MSLGAGLLVLILADAPAHAQGVQGAAPGVTARAAAAALGAANDADSLLNPALDGNPRNLPRFRPARIGQDTDRSRFGELPSYRYQPAAGASTTGFDSTNARKRKAGQKAKPGSAGSAVISGVPQNAAATGQPNAAAKSDPTKPDAATN